MLHHSIYILSLHGTPICISKMEHIPFLPVRRKNTYGTTYMQVFNFCKIVVEDNSKIKVQC